MGSYLYCTYNFGPVVLTPCIQHCTMIYRLKLLLPKSIYFSNPVACFIIQDSLTLFCWVSVYKYQVEDYLPSQNHTIMQYNDAQCRRREFRLLFKVTIK